MRLHARPVGRSFARLLALADQPLRTVVVVGERDDPAVLALRRLALRQGRRDTLVIGLPPDAPPALAAWTGLAGKAPAGRSARAYVCAGASCLPPASSPERLARALAETAPA